MLRGGGYVMGRGLVRTSDPLGAERSLDVEQLLHGQRVGLLVAHHGHVVQTIKVGQCLHTHGHTQGGSDESHSVRY